MPQARSPVLNELPISRSTGSRDDRSPHDPQSLLGSDLFKASEVEQNLGAKQLECVERAFGAGLRPSDFTTKIPLTAAPRAQTRPVSLARV